MIYMRNITITTAKSATYLENVGYDSSRVPGKKAVVLFADSSSITEDLDSAESIKLKMVNYEEIEFSP